MKTPYFVLDSKQLKQNYQNLNLICKKILKDFKIAYSVKTNTLKQVISILSKEESGFEVASLKEIKAIPKNKFTVFNGPCKTEEELKLAIKNKFLINIDSKSEIDKISSIVKNKRLDIGIRITLKDNKFGIPINQLNKTIEYAKSKNLNPISIHFHQGTQLFLASYEKNIIAFAKILKQIPIKLKYIDVGGGFPSKPQLKNLNKTIDSYLSLIKNYIPNTTIIIEPGRYLIEDSMSLITKVCVIKESQNNTYAILDAGINVLPKITLARYRFSQIKNKSKQTNKSNQTYILAGPLLFSIDTLGKFQGNLEEGDSITST